MDIIELTRDSFRRKVLDCYDNYLKISSNHTLAIGIYYKGNYYIFGNGIDEALRYDIGSISKTMTAHLILYLSTKGYIDINKSIDFYIPLKTGKYPTIYELLTHTAGYHNLTPVEITIPRLIKKGYAKKNVYEGCNDHSIIKSLEKRNKHKSGNGYGYSDFAYAVLALIAKTIIKSEFSILFEEFINYNMNLNNTKLFIDKTTRKPMAIKNKTSVSFWSWNHDNPYLASGGLSSNIQDMIRYIALEIESEEEYITKSHQLCPESFNKRNNIGTCIGWHTYKKSNQLWHVGGVGTFRSSIIINKHNKCGVVVLGNAKGKNSANVHYLAKMLYSELKIKKIFEVNYD